MTKPISKAKVKKLADRRIAKAAPELSVANSAALGGQPPGAYVESAVEPWHVVNAPGEPGFAAGWHNYDEGGNASTGAFYRDPLGLVHLRGELGSSNPGTTAAFTLPAGYRPSQPLTLPTIDINTGGTPNPGLAIVAREGGVFVLCPDPPCVPTLNGLTFRADG